MPFADQVAEGVVHFRVADEEVPHVLVERDVCRPAIDLELWSDLGFAPVDVPGVDVAIVFLGLLRPYLAGDVQWRTFSPRCGGEKEEFCGSAS